MDAGDVAMSIAGDRFAFVVLDAHDVAQIPMRAWGACDAILVRNRIKIDQAVVAKLAKCQLIVRVGVGFDNIDLSACTARGIPVCNVPNYGTTEIADHTIGLLLYLVRGIGIYEERLRADLAANYVAHGAPVIRRLRGLTFGAVGMGRTGTAAARRAAALDMRIAYYDPLLPEGHELGVGVGRARSLSQLLAMSDIVSLHAPLNEQTHKMMNADRLSEMRHGAILINVARGKLVDLDAIHDALRSGQLGAAALDVLPDEPPDPSAELFQAWLKREPWLAGRLALTPHAAFYSEDACQDRRLLSAGMVRDFFERALVRNCVNGGWERFASARGLPNPSVLWDQAAS
jgi:D-3-phosphoglycerate dehydrogenase